MQEQARKKRNEAEESHVKRQAKGQENGPGQKSEAAKDAQHKEDARSLVKHLFGHDHTFECFGLQEEGALIAKADAQAKSCSIR